MRFLFATPYYSNKSILRYCSYITFSISLFFFALFAPGCSRWIISLPHSVSALSLALVKIIRPKFCIIIDIRDNPFQPNTNKLASLYNLIEYTTLVPALLATDIFVGLGKKNFLYFPFPLRELIRNKFRYVPMTAFHPNIIYNSYKSYESDSNYIFVGTLTDAFDLNNILLNFSKSQSKSKLNIIGDGPLLGYYAKKFFSDSRIIFHGFLPINEIERIASECRYGFLPYSSIGGRFKHHFTNKFAGISFLRITADTTRTL